MKRMTPFLLLAFVLLLVAIPAFPAAPAAATDCGFVRDPAAAKLGFEAYRKTVSAAVRRSGDKALAARLDGLVAGRPVPAADSGIAGCLLRGYTVARYGDRMVADLQHLVGFRTEAQEGKENWALPEFVRQREWLAGQAKDSGFQFKSYDGRVDEITMPGAAPTLAVLTHGDVQGVENQRWSSPPWDGKIVDGKIIGRGTEDDKGPIVSTFYSMVALRDTGWPLSATLRLLIANGEESSWDEIPYYLARAPMPNMTIGIGARAR